LKSGWVVIWPGKSCNVFLKADGEWSLDPDEAFIFVHWFAAKAKVAFKDNARVERCWYDDERFMDVEERV
jgi:hypothetical protein